ncbi:MAG: hypothetical protein ACT6Q9_13260 [Polaromonas sp.]|uniref:hypothetical protein n=1 Tax=Polaromonas sp. TaxID=1869339 RepID=UPI004035CEF7
MSILNWFSGKSAAHEAPGKVQADSDSAGLTRGKPSTPVSSKPAAGELRNGAQKSHRHARRELLYAAVREAMIRAGVLSGSYKFKVLSLDPRGEQFMVMMDLAQEFGAQAERLAEMEVMIAHSAKSRYNIRVTAVYWRLNELVSVARPAGAPQVSSRPAPLYHAEAAPAVAVTVAPAAAALPEPALAVDKPVVKRYEPIQADEVAAFKQALAAASAHGVPAEAVPLSRSAPRSYTLLTGFEDTEMPESPALVPALSATQYGDLH